MRRTTPHLSAIIFKLLFGEKAHACRCIQCDPNVEEHVKQEALKKLKELWRPGLLRTSPSSKVRTLNSRFHFIKRSGMAHIYITRSTTRQFNRKVSNEQDRFQSLARTPNDPLLLAQHWIWRGKWRDILFSSAVHWWFQFSVDVRNGNLILNLDFMADLSCEDPIKLLLLPLVVNSIDRRGTLHAARAIFRLPISTPSSLSRLLVVLCYLYLTIPSMQTDVLWAPYSPQAKIDDSISFRCRTSPRSQAD